MKLSLLSTFILLTTALSAPSPQPAPEPQLTVTPKNRHGPSIQPRKVSTKYFNEPGGDNELGHYDIRYYSGAPVTYEQRGETLYHLIRSYLTFFRAHDVETWIAHGTLLGWWWNGQIMPWDWDLDVQVSASTLTWLGENMNMTQHNYTSTARAQDGGGEVSRQYLLDINPYHVERVRGDGMNVIDARWIDMSNGLFIDITGLAETNPTQQPGIWSCKNYHRYRTRDIYPLRETAFEGVPALVPYSFDRILVEEYSARALTKTMHEGHVWNAEQKEWLRQDQVTWSQHTRDVPVAHAPRSLPGEGGSVKGLTALKNLF